MNAWQQQREQEKQEWEKQRKCAWEKLQAGDIEGGLADFRRFYEAEGKDLSEATRLGVALLWLKRYEEAKNHFDAHSDLQKAKYDCMYHFSGTARWCLEDRKGAIAVWKSALKCGYTDWARMETPLMLYFGAVCSPELYEVQTALDLILSRLAKHWEECGSPLHYARLLLGEVDRMGALANVECKTANDALEECRHVDFWGGVKSLAEGDRAAYRSAMGHVSQLTWDDYAANEDLFTSILWRPMFFLARHEAERND